MITPKNIIITLLLFLVFVYGMAIGRYEIFPYGQISDIRYWFLNNVMGQEQRFGDITIQDSFLHRLLIKSIEIEEDHSSNLFIMGGAIASLDHLLYLNTNRNDEKKGHLVVFDIENYKRMDTGGIAVPMNVEELMNSSVMDQEAFPFYRFRINDIHVEKSGENEHTIFVSHNEYHPDERCITYSISRTSVEYNNTSLKQLTKWNTIFTATPCINSFPGQNSDGNTVSYDIDQVNPDIWTGDEDKVFPANLSGGAMVSYDEDHLLVTVGSFHRDGIKFESLPMDSSSAFGKVLLMNKKTGDFSIYAEGTRNAQGLTIDSNGNIWATDMGPRGGDELNLVKEGKNFGWPEVTYGLDYNYMPWPNSNQQGRHDQYDLPAFAWFPAIAPSSIIEITDSGRDRFKLWDGDLIVGGLRGQGINRLRIGNTDRVIYNESIRMRNRIRGLTMLNDGKIALISDDGLLYIIDEGGTKYENENNEIVEKSRVKELERFENLRGGSKTSGMKAQEATAQTIFMQKCSTCHNLNGPNINGPRLEGIFERNIGSLDDFNYSSALTNKNRQWNSELMKSFLLNPNDEFANNSMQEVSLTESEADSIIQFLMK